MEAPAASMAVAVGNARVAAVVHTAARVAGMVVMMAPDIRPMMMAVMVVMVAVHVHIKCAGMSCIDGEASPASPGI